VSATAPRNHTRIALWKLFGAPTDQIGSVNEPRTHEEYGVRWNEKWIYRAESGQAIERIVLWYRYDFQGAFRLKPDGSAEPEPLPAG
jgi:hypothetical protein